MRTWIAATLIALAPFSVEAQQYPNKNITIVVNSEAGGPVDLIARVMQDPMAKTLGQPIIVENRLGAGGVTGAAYVAKRPADGYTILMSGPGPMVLAPLLYTTVPYKPLEEFETVHLAVDVPVALAVSSKLEVKTLAELIARAKAKPGEVSYGTAGIGTPGHLGSELFKSLLGLDLKFIPYKGSPAAILGLVTGELGLHLTTPAAAYSQLEAGNVRFLAVTGNKRLAGAPDAPTFTEAGMPEMTVPAWFGLFAPKGTPREIIDTLSKASKGALSQPEVVKKLEGGAFNIVSDDAQRFDTYWRAETKKWDTVIKENKIKVE